jgi:2-haloacid dehalogenase
VFIDDKLENVDAARRLGLHGIHFTEPGAARMALRALGLPV